MRSYWVYYSYLPAGLPPQSRGNRMCAGRQVIADTFDLAYRTFLDFAASNRDHLEIEIECMRSDGNPVLIQKG
jgi:hypothetical protein